MERSKNEHPLQFCRWSHTVEVCETSVVLPDGCQDVLVIAKCDCEPDMVRMTSWDSAPRQVKLSAGTVLTGFRLRPGTFVDLRDLEAEAQNLTDPEAGIGSILRCDHEITEIIDDLSRSGAGVGRLARQQGVSERTLQRHFKTLSLPPPGFWRQLGRARRAVQALPCRVPLSEIALEYGYSDQAHMTREFVRWFGKTPVQLRRSQAVLKDLAQPGLGNWSGQPIL